MDEKLLMKIIEYVSAKKEDGIPEISFDLSSVTEENISDPKETGLKLKDCLELFKIENNFKEGQLVTWKKGLKNRRYPKYDEPAIVIEVLTQPVFSDESESGSRYFREPLDIILGVMIDNDFEIFHYDKRRLIPLNDDITTK